MNIILASSSPRRHELLSRLDLSFNTSAVDIDESIVSNESPAAYIKRMVSQKSLAFITQNKETNTFTSPTLLLTADTIGVMPNGTDILVKPTDKADAFAMWQQMSDNYHYVWTAVQATLLATDYSILWQQQITEVTEVQFIPLTALEMESYWQTGEPSDKAGGYAIQGKAAAWVNRIEGSYTNVVGLPLAQTKHIIEQAKNKLSILSQ